MKFWREYRYKKRLKKLARELQDKLTAGPQPVQTYLPLCYPSWVRFWKDVHKNYEYIVLPYIEQDGGVAYFTNEPHVWLKEYIRQMAIKEAVEEEKFELAQQIKEE